MSAEATRRVGPGPAAGIVVVGAGECGARAAFGLRDLGYAGRIVLVGDEGHHPYERPPLSKGVAGSAEPSIVYTAEHMRQAGVEYLLGREARSLDTAARTVLLDDGVRLAYDRLLLATGARARALRCRGHELAHTFRTLADAVELRRRLVPGARVCIVGGGFIGLEMAASAVAAGCRVTVLEAAPRLLSRVVPAGVAEVLAERHRTAGVELCTGVVVESVERDGPAGLTVTTTGHGVVPCDLVLAGVGAAPNVELARRAGLTVEDGILVDPTLATSDPAVYAAGDCARFPHPDGDGSTLRMESWRNAVDQAGAVAGNLLGRAEPYVPVPWFWSDQYELGLQIAGLPGPDRAEVVRRGSRCSLWFELDAAGVLTRASGLGPGTSVAKDIRVALLLIAARQVVDPEMLADPDVPLKRLLRAAQR
jgi:3-phenylpropionate/trans-cinnamate dioxygenase ferredoxin reductase subunit